MGAHRLVPCLLQYKIAHVRCTINLDMRCAALLPLLVEDFAQVRGGNPMDILINKQCFRGNGKREAM